MKNDPRKPSARSVSSRSKRAGGRRVKGASAERAQAPLIEWFRRVADGDLPRLPDLLKDLDFEANRSRTLSKRVEAHALRAGIRVERLKVAMRNLADRFAWAEEPQRTATRLNLTDSEHADVMTMVHVALQIEDVLVYALRIIGELPRIVGEMNTPNASIQREANATIAGARELCELLARANALPKLAWFVNRGSLLALSLNKSAIAMQDALDFEALGRGYRAEWNTRKAGRAPRTKLFAAADEVERQMRDYQKKAQRGGKVSFTAASKMVSIPNPSPAKKGASYGPEHVRKIAKIRGVVW